MKEEKEIIVPKYRPKTYKYIFILGFILIAMILCFQFREQLFYSFLVYLNPYKEARLSDYITENYHVTEEQIKERNVFTISSDAPNNLAVFYLHGGAYAKQYTKEHWYFIGELIDNTNVTVITPDYPLLPTGTYEEVFDMVIPAYESAMEEYGTENIIVIGDSAGGGIALALTEYLNLNQKEIPRHTILLAPWLDTSMSNPEISTINDQNLDLPLIKACGKKYANGNFKNYLASPLYGELEGLENIHLFIGTDDMLNPDAHKLVENGKLVGTEISLYEYQDMPHIWMFYYENTKRGKRHFRQTDGKIVDDSKRAKEEIYRIIMSDM